MGASGVRQMQKLGRYQVESWRKAPVDHEDMGAKVQKEISCVSLQKEKSC